MKMNTNREWLRKMAEREDECESVAVGGSMFMPPINWQHRCERLEQALIDLRDGLDSTECHCDPVPAGSSWRYVIDRALDKIL